MSTLFGYYPGMAKTPRGDTYHVKDLKRTLMRSVREEIRQYGAAAASLRRIAKRAGVSHAAPYRHFNGKDGLIAALCWEGQREFTARLTEARAGGASPAERIVRLGTAYLEFAKRNPEIFNLMFMEIGGRAMEGNLPADFKESWADYDSFTVLEDTVKECQGDGTLDPSEDSGALAIMIWSFIHGFAFIQMEGFARKMGGSRGHSPEETERVVMRAFKGLILGGRARKPARS